MATLALPSGVVQGHAGYQAWRSGVSAVKRLFDIRSIGFLPPKQLRAFGTRGLELINVVVEHVCCVKPLAKEKQRPFCAVCVHRSRPSAGVTHEEAEVPRSADVWFGLGDGTWPPRFPPAPNEKGGSKIVPTKYQAQLHSACAAVCCFHVW